MNGLKLDKHAMNVIAALSGLVIPTEYHKGVLRQWRLNHALAAPLLAFELPDGIPPAPVFEP